MRPNGRGSIRSGTACFEGLAPEAVYGCFLQPEAAAKALRAALQGIDVNRSSRAAQESASGPRVVDVSIPHSCSRTSGGTL